MKQCLSYLQTNVASKLVVNIPRLSAFQQQRAGMKRKVGWFSRVPAPIWQKENVGSLEPDIP